jgi:hypothetical protein
MTTTTNSDSQCDNAKETRFFVSNSGGPGNLKDFLSFLSRKGTRDFQDSLMKTTTPVNARLEASKQTPQIVLKDR